jgi:hypothetical protein
MVRSLAVLLAVPLLALVARGADEPKDIIKRAIKAHGGEEFLTKNQAQRSSNKGKLDIPGVGEVDFTQETAVMLPDKFRESVELSIAGMKISVVTRAIGDKVVIEVNGKEVELPDAAKAAMQDIGQVMKMGRLVPLLGKEYELNLIGDDKVEGKEVIGVRVSRKDQKDVSMYFDKKTNLLAKVEHRTVDPMSGNEITEERIVAAYEKNKDGVMLPKKVLVKRDGKKFLEAEVQEITFLEKIDDGEFKK